VRRRSGYTEGELRELRSAVAESVRDEIPREVLATRIGAVVGGMKTHAKRFKYRLGLTHKNVGELLRAPCHYCGHVHPAGGGVDRVDSRIGYVPENCVPCCAECNMLMGDIPPEAKRILKPALEAIREHDYFGWVANQKRRVVNETLPRLRKLSPNQLANVVSRTRERVEAERDRLMVHQHRSHPSNDPEVERATAFHAEPFTAVADTGDVEVIRKRPRS
jgi:hypothetical protein